MVVEWGYFGNFVYYNLCSGGERLQVGFILITTNAAGTLVVDTNGDEFDDLDTAILGHAEELLTIERRLGEWRNVPPAHATPDGRVEKAFTQKDLADAQAVANSA